MPFRGWWNRATELAGVPHSRGLTVTADEWSRCAADVAAGGGRLLAMWASDCLDELDERAGAGSAAGLSHATEVHAAFLTGSGLLILQLPIQRNHAPEAVQADYPGIETVFPCASRMQRAMSEISELRSSDPDRRSWLRHLPDGQELIRVSGEGVHEVAVGPVHAGTIEPGHFRFSVVGEKVLRLEERFGYTHKGIERRFLSLPLHEGHRLAARIAADSTVAYSWAYCQALEAMASCVVPPRAVALRALYLELERIANHLGDVGALGNDAGFAFGLTQFSRIKEDLLRTVKRAFGQRYLLDAVVPGGTRVDIAAEDISHLAACIEAIARETVELRAIYDDHSGVRNRFIDAGILTSQLAMQLGVIGLAGRASGQALDARIDFPVAPYDELSPRKVVRQNGDVAARVEVRFEEIAESCRLVQSLLISLPPGAHRAPVGTPREGSFATGLLEGWRGPVFIALEAGAEGSIRRCHPHDPSWQNWPAIEHAILGNIIADFPLINKSFNLVYCGVDL